MKVSELLQNGFSEILLPEPDREIKGVYVGDLLSWVMGKTTSDQAWITIMSNLNVIAVATLNDLSCVILAEGVQLENEVIEKARAQGVNLLSFGSSAYDAAVLLSKLV